MLKRRSKLQKYIRTLKNKQIKKSNQNLKQHTVLKHKIDIDSNLNNNELKKQDQHAQRNQEILDIHVDGDQEQGQRVDGDGDGEKPCWYDPEDEEREKVVIQGSNKFKKIGKFGGQTEMEVEEYEKKLGKFYQAKYKRVNWAKQADQLQQKDINDYLNQQLYFSSKKPSKKTIKYHTKISQNHESIITGLTWHKHILFTCGLDHKLKAHHFSPTQPNPDLKLTQQKDIYIKDLPLSNCYYKSHKQELVIGSLRKNLVKVDTQKWMPQFITSAFLKDFKTYENLRANPQNDGLAIFGGSCVGFLDKNYVYAGMVRANEKLQDVCYGGEWGVYGVTNQALYEWDIRKMEIVRMEKKYLGYTTVASTPSTLAIGSKLGTIYFHQPNTPLNSSLQNKNILTDISQLCPNSQGSLCIGLSKWKSNSIRIIDTMTSKSIGDWPNAKTKVGIPLKGVFGVGDYFAVGNANGGVGVYGVQSEIL